MSVILKNKQDWNASLIFQKKENYQPDFIFAFLSIIIILLMNKEVQEVI